MSDFEKEYNDLLDNIRKAHEEVAPKINMLLREAKEKQDEAIRLAEEHMVGFEVPGSQEMYVSTKIKDQVHQLVLDVSKNDEGKAFRIYETLEQRVLYDLQDILGFYAAHPIYDHLIYGHWVPSVYDC